MDYLLLYPVLYWHSWRALWINEEERYWFDQPTAAKNVLRSKRWEGNVVLVYLPRPSWVRHPIILFDVKKPYQLYCEIDKTKDEFFFFPNGCETNYHLLVSLCTLFHCSYHSPESSTSNNWYVGLFQYSVWKITTSRKVCSQLKLKRMN